MFVPASHLSRCASARSAFAAGAVAGALDTCITMPLDTVKTQMQLKSYPGPVACTRAIVKADGVAGLYYGFRPFLIQASGKAAVRFFMYENICALVDKCGADRSSNPAKWSMLCGMGAGMCEALFWTAPTERLKVLRQAHAGAGIGGGTTTVMTVVREQGMSGLYVGALPTALRQASSTAVRFATLAHIKQLVCGTFGYDKKSAPSWVTFLAGGTGGAVSALLNNPIDVRAAPHLPLLSRALVFLSSSLTPLLASSLAQVVKSRIQAGQGDKSMMTCMRQTIEKDGLAVLGAGLQARTTRLFLSQAIQFTIVDAIVARMKAAQTPPQPQRHASSKVLPSRHPSVVQ